MEYEKLYQGFLNLFSEDRSILNNLAKEHDVDESLGQHIMFGYVVVPYIYSLLKSKDETKLRKAFAYFEEMAKDSDHKVTEVLEFTLLENFLTESAGIANGLKPYMGPETLVSASNVGNYMNTY